MPHIVKTDAFVLRKRELLDRDLLIYLFTHDFGKITVIAKGSTSLTSRRAPHLQTGNMIKILMNVRNEYRYLQQTELISGFTAIKDSPHKIEYLYFYIFILDRFLPDNQQEHEMYRLTRAFMAELSRTPEYGIHEMTKYVNMAMRLLGYVHEDKEMPDLIRLIEETIREKIPFHII